MVMAMAMAMGIPEASATAQPVSQAIRSAVAALARLQVLLLRDPY